MNSHFVKRTCCPACKSTRYIQLFSCGFLKSPIKEYLDSFYSTQGKGVEYKYLAGAEFILVECNDCGTVYQKEILDDFLMNKLYEEWIEPEVAADRHIQSNDNLDYYSVYAKEVIMLIAYFHTMPSCLNFLDFGMGWGKWCRMATAFGCNAYGTELSEARIEYAKSYGVKVITWNEIPDHSFDFINTEQVFEHIPEPLETLNYLKKSLKPKGLIKISVPNGNDIKKKLKIMDWTAPKRSKNSLNPVAPLEHINCFTYHSIVKMADVAGLELIKIPLSIQYGYSTGWKPIKPILRNILHPLYRNTLQKSTYLFFRRKYE